MYYLRYVTYGCSPVTNDACQRRRKGRTSQSCTSFAAPVQLSPRRREQDGSRLLRLTSPSVQVSSTGRTIETGCSYPRCQDCFHCQAVRRAGGTFALIRQCEGLIVRRYRNSRSRCFSVAEDKAWLIGHEVDATQFDWNIDLIVCFRKNWNRFTRCCCRTSDGLSHLQTRRQIRRRN